MRLIATTVIAGLLATASTGADIVAQGSKLPWSATIPNGWVGGTAQQIEKVLALKNASPDQENLKKLLRPLLADARQLDAYFCHIDVAGTKTTSTLRINVLSLDVALDDKMERTMLWNSYAKQTKDDFPPGVTMEVTDDRTGTTGGRKAYRGTFVLNFQNGEKVYTVLHLVDYAPNKTHVFILRADSTKIRDRTAELDKIVESLQYRE